VAVKEPAFPFIKLPGVDPVLGPEMKSTGEVMGIDYDFGLAFYKAELAAGMRLPLGGTVFISVRRKDKNEKLLYLARKFKELGFRIIATDGTRDYLMENDIEAELALKVSQGRPNILDAIVNRQVNLIINTPSGKRGRTEDYMIRRAAVDYGVAHITTMAGALAAVRAIEAVKSKKMVVKSIQEYHESCEKVIVDHSVGQ